MDTQYVALLRAVNVGGVKVLMKPLCDMCRDFGWTDVKSYIASGNLVFRAGGSAGDLAKQIQDGLSEELGVSPDVLVIPAQDYIQIVQSHPFYPEKGNQSHIYFCWSAPKIADDLYTSLKRPEEDIKIIEDHIHFYAPNGIGRSKLVERFDKVITGTLCTGRNMNTARKLIDILDTLQGDD